MTPVLRQCLVVITVQLAALSVGGAIVFPSVLLQQFNSTELDFDTASWIGSIHGLAGVPSVFMPCLMQYQGRRVTFIAASLILVTGWVVAYFAPSAALILLSESLHGLATNSIFTVSMHSITEMISPDYKNVCMVSYLALQTFTMGMTSVLARYLTWKSVSIVMGVPAICAVLLGFTWPESPAWLAWRGRPDECRRAHKTLRGNHPQANNELQELIYKLDRSYKDITFFQSLKCRDFYLPCLHMYLLLHLTYFSGSISTLIYAAQIVKSLNGDETSIGLATIVVNFINFIGVTLSSALLWRFNNKSVIVLSGFCTAGGLIWCGVGKTGLWAVGATAATASLGLTSAVFSVSAELVSVRHRGAGGAFNVIITCALHASSLKLAPYLLRMAGAHCTMLLYAGNAAVCSALVWWCLPETKGKTVTQIEEQYNISNRET